MSQDVFSREVTFGGAFSADGARITFADLGAGLLVQNLNYQYQQSISRLYEVGSPDIYLVAGRTQGTVTMNRVVGPKRILPEFYQQYGNVCNAGNNNIKFSAATGCGGAVSTRQVIDIRHAIVTALGGAVNANDMIINESLTMMFLYLQIR